MNEENSKLRTRMWVTGDSDFNKRFSDWANSKGMIAEDLHRIILEDAMQHGTLSFFVERGYQNIQLEHQTR